MATSGTTTFTLDTEELIAEAFERNNRQVRTGYDIKSAKRSLNLLLSEWGNRGVHIWKVENHTINLVAGTTAYQLPGNTDDILEAVFRNNNVDTTMTQVSRSEYLQIPNKFSQGTPSQYYIQQEIFTSNGHANVTINLYLTPNVTDTQINFNYMARIQDAGSYTNIPDIYYTFYPCLTSGLAFYLSQKYNPAKTQELKMYYEDELNRALIEGSQSTSVHLTPSNFFPSGY
jgi:hypothetical protein